LQISEKGEKLPLPQNNIKVGNSLIDDPSVSDKAFKWEEEFPDIIKEGGFDVIIGNPPYIDSEEMTKSQDKERNFISQKYSVAKGNWDIYCVFVQKSETLLKPKGVLGMIVPNKILKMDYAKELRHYLSSYSINRISDYSKMGVFDADNYPIVIITTKEPPRKNMTTIDQWENSKEATVSNHEYLINQEEFSNDDTWSHIFYSTGMTLLKRIKDNSKNLNYFVEISGAFTVSEAYKLISLIIERTESKEDYFKFINTGTIDRYNSLWGVKKTTYIKKSFFEPVILSESFKRTFPRRYEQAKATKLIVGGMTKRIECYLDSGEYLAGKSTIIIIPKQINPYLLIGILNSKLISYVHRMMYQGSAMSGGILMCLLHK
jgi:hypothetical protein